MKLRKTVLPIAILSAVVSLAGMTVGAALPAAVASPVDQARQVPSIPLATWPGLTSGNWSGYGGPSAPGKKLTFASATWRVPSVKKVTGFSSTWVGIDGFSNPDLIQTGTEQDFSNGKLVYRAWWEILPAPETIIGSLTISPGDTMSAFVRNTSGSKWLISITDVTTGKNFSINKTYTGPGTSAEWIQEAPSGPRGVLPLAHYKETEFSKLTVAVNFGAATNPQLAFPREAIAMVQKGLQVSTPSKPTGGNSFNVAYGKKQPAAP
jgi:Peptidase A4 family